jgi:hypothetical protein
MEPAVMLLDPKAPVVLQQSSEETPRLVFKDFRAKLEDARWMSVQKLRSDDASVAAPQISATVGRSGKSQTSVGQGSSPSSNSSSDLQ